MIGLACLSLATLAVNLRLYRVNAQLARQLDTQLQAERLANSPQPGWVMPLFKATRLDGRDGTINFQFSAPKVAVLVFNPNCPPCDQNWVFWNKLLANPDINQQILLITEANSISPEYRQQHHLLAHHVRIAVDPAIIREMRLGAVPQTVYLEGGTVRRIWFGLLSDDDVREIAQDINSD
jgi:hypothetical protein